MVVLKQKKKKRGESSGECTLQFPRTPLRKSQANRLLISVTVPGSAGPIRFMINEGELVAGVIDTALKLYAREGRLPVLGSDFNKFILYCIAGSEVLSPLETIGTIGLVGVRNFGLRNFVLCKKLESEKAIDSEKLVGVRNFGLRNFVPCKKPEAEKAIDSEKLVGVRNFGLRNFVLCKKPESEKAIDSEKLVGVRNFGLRNFVPCKKPEAEKAFESEKLPSKGSGRKSWFNRLLSLKISSSH